MPCGGLGTPYTRRCGIPQGCPFSMMFVALLMRPWIIMMRAANVFATLLADDVLIISVGSRMVGRFAKALDRTHEYLTDMGSRVAPSTSFNFSNSAQARGGCTRRFCPTSILRLMWSKTSAT